MIQRYTRAAVWLHWTVATLIVANVVLAWTWNSLPDAQVRPAIDLHKSFGITVLGLAILRLLWRYAHPAPPLPEGYRRWERVASHSVHALLYVVLFAMPLTGWIMDSAYKDAAAHPLNLYGAIPWFRIPGVTGLDPATKKAVHDAFGAAHEFIAWLIYGLLFLHVGGALKHQWLDRAPELQRMGWPGRRGEVADPR